MFGAYRLILALMVAIGHLAGVNNVGAYAVFGFYILSGYLMTLILHSSYGYTWGGFGRYALNRFLRIYPLYWISALVTVALIFWLGPTSVATYHHAMRLPTDWASGLQNFFIMFLPGDEPRLIPPSWALTVELFFYLCIGMGLSRTPVLTIVWFVASVLYTVYVNVAGMGFEFKYFVIPAASLPFSTGAMIYIFKDRISALSLVHHRLTPFILFGLYLANYAVNRQLGSLDSTGFYLSYVLNAMLVMTLACSSLPFLSRRGDSFLGDFSYPVYLIHLQAGLLVLALSDSLARGELKFALVTLPIVLLLSWVLIKLLEKPIERLRRMFKKTPMAAPDQQSPESAHSRASSARGCI